MNIFSDITRSRNARREAQVAMPIVLVLVATFVFLASVVAFIAYNESTAGKRGNESLNALYLAKIGVNDALLRLAKDYNFSSSQYTVTLTSGTATVTVQNDTPSQGKKQITSTGAGSTGLFSIKRKIVSVVSIDANGKIILESSEEQSL